jgi:Spy/CpxP family protein refolding chaperone
MSNRNLKLFLLLSLAFNLSFLVTAVYLQLESPPESSSHPLVEHLGITEKQESRIVEEMHLFHSKINEIRTAVRPWKRELLDEIQRKEPDQAQIAASIREIGKLQQELQEAVVRHLLTTKKELNPEQNKKFMQFLEAGMLSRPDPGVSDMMRHWFFE